MSSGTTSDGLFKGGVIRPVVRREYVSLPNSILVDRRLSLDTRGMLCLLLSKSRGWEIRPRALAKELSREGSPFGRRRLDRMFREAMAAGYMIRSEKQAHKDDGSFGRYAYLVGMPQDLETELRGIEVGSPHSRHTHAHDAHTRVAHAQNAETQSHQIKTPQKTDSNNDDDHQSEHPEAGMPAQPKVDCRDGYSALGRGAPSAGMVFVWAGSEPFKAWRAFQGDEGMPLIDMTIIDGRERRGCWFPSLYPPTGRPPPLKTAVDESNPNATSSPRQHLTRQPNPRFVMLEPGSAEWHAERDRMIAAGGSTKFMDSQAANGVGWSVER